MKITLIVLATLLIVLPGYAADDQGQSRAEVGSWQVKSPGSNVKVMLNLGDGETALTFSVTLNDRTVVGTSPMGVTLADADFVNGLTFVSEKRRTLYEFYELPTGKKTNHFNNFNELVLSFVNTSGLPVEIDVRVFEDGMGYRYRFPGEGDVTVLSEASGFAVPVRPNM